MKKQKTEIEKYINGNEDKNAVSGNLNLSK